MLCFSTESKMWYSGHHYDPKLGSVVNSTKQSDQLSYYVGSTKYYLTQDDWLVIRKTCSDLIYSGYFFCLILRKVFSG